MTSFQNESVSSFTDLITKVDAWMVGIGWNSDLLDVTATPTTGGEWAMNRSGSAGEVRFAASWDGAGTPSNMGLYHYVGQAYDTLVRPWEQDNDSGNGFAGKADASIATERHVAIGTSPIQYWGFENPLYTHIIVEVAAGEYAHFGFGILDKNGDWTGGSYVFGQRNSGTTGAAQAERDDRTHLLDGLFNDTSDTGGLLTGSELHAATIHCEGLPNQPAGGKFAVCMGGKQASPQTTFGTDRQSNDGSSTDKDRVLFTWGLRSGPFANATYRASGTDLSGELRMWPIAHTYVDSNGDIHGFPIGRMKDVFGCGLQRYLPEDTVDDDEGNTYHLFPAHKRYSGSGAQTGTSGNLGVAYKFPLFEDPGLPENVNDPTAWYSSRLEADYTISAGEVTQLDDKSGNGNHLTVPSGRTGPSILTINGRTWLDYDDTVPNLLGGVNTAVDPDAGDFTYVIVFKSAVSSTAGLFGKGPGQGGSGTDDQNFGMFVAVSNSRSLYFQMRDEPLPNTDTRVVEHDNASHDYTDDTARIAGVTYIDADADLFLYGADDATAVDSDLVASTGTITPNDVFYLGDWKNTEWEFDGQIAEFLAYDRVLQSAERANLWTYLEVKWDI